MLDIFNADPFTSHSLTDAINVLPYTPQRIGAMGLFTTKNPTTHVVFLERKGNIISLIPTKPRGSGETTKHPRARRDLVPLVLPHVPYTDDLLAAELSGLREFDTETQIVTASSMLNEILESMRQDHEATHEYFRIGAIKGIVLDADPTQAVLLNLFTAFGITQQTFAFNLAAATGAQIKQKCIDIIRYIEGVLGGATYDHIHAFCGNTFFDLLTTNADVAEAYSWQQSPNWKIVTQGQGTTGRGTSTVTFGDITFENYRGKVGSAAFIQPDKAHFFPVGVPNLFRQYYGPANTMTDVNTPGREVYAMQKPKEWDEGVDVKTESNPLMICTRPSVLVLGDSDATVGLLAEFDTEQGQGTREPKESPEAEAQAAREMWAPSGEEATPPEGVETEAGGGSAGAGEDVEREEGGEEPKRRRRR